MSGKHLSLMKYKQDIQKKNPPNANPLSTLLLMSKHIDRDCLQETSSKPSLAFLILFHLNGYANAVSPKFAPSNGFLQDTVKQHPSEKPSGHVHYKHKRPCHSTWKPLGCDARVNLNDHLSSSRLFLIFVCCLRVSGQCILQITSFW